MLRHRPATRRAVLAAALAAPLVIPRRTAAQDPSWPTRPVRLIVPFGPGGSTEGQMRIIANRLAAAWKQPVVVETRPGAGTTIGAAFVAAAPPDGHILYAMPGPSHAIAGTLYHPLPYDPIGGFAGISLVAIQPLILVNRPNAGIASLPDLLRIARSRPGALTYGSTGVGASPHLAVEALKAQAGVDLLHVPFNGSSSAATAVLAKQVDLAICDSSALALVRDGALRALGVTTPARWPGLPEVPTFAESGLPGYDMTSWVGLFAPGAVPRPLIERINAALLAVLAEPEVGRLLLSNGYQAAPTTPEEAQARLRDDTAKYGELVRRVGLRRE